MNFYIKTLLFLLLFTLVIFTLHYFYVLNFYVEEQPFNLYKLYGFLSIATYLSVSGMHYLYGLVPNQLGYVFLVTVFVKFGAALILFPQLLSSDPKLTQSQILSFLIPYFLFLSLEAYTVIKWLNKTPLDSKTS